MADEKKRLTMAASCPVVDNQNVMTASPKGDSYSNLLKQSSESKSKPQKETSYE
jgi:hypothetical protein